MTAPGNKLIDKNLNISKFIKSEWSGTIAIPTSVMDSFKSKNTAMDAK
jgi:hypothetical protein